MHPQQQSQQFTPAKQRERDARPSQRGLNIPESGHHNSLSPPLHLPSLPLSSAPFLLPSTLVITESPERLQGKESERGRVEEKR
ncbi:hypothetical protein L3Q82_020780, partial [Scortum barcoo]